MEPEEWELPLEYVLAEVEARYFMPIALALKVLTEAACKEPDVADFIAKSLQSLAPGCPAGVGRGLLILLAELAARRGEPSPDDFQATLRSHLTLVRGGKPPDDATPP